MNRKMSINIPEKPLPTKNTATYSLPYIDANPVDDDLTKQLDVPIKNEIIRSK